MLGLYYIDYCPRLWPKSGRKMIICYTRIDALARIADANIPDDWFFWLSECRTPGYLITGNKEIIINWIEVHMPDKLGDPLR